MGKPLYLERFLVTFQGREIVEYVYIFADPERLQELVMELTVSLFFP